MDRRRQSRRCSYSPSHRCAWQAPCIRAPWTSYKQDALRWYPRPTGSSSRHQHDTLMRNQQAKQQAPPVDFRPRGIGGSIMHVIGTAFATQEGSEVGRALAPLQLAAASSESPMAPASWSPWHRPRTRTDSRASRAATCSMDLKHAYGTIRRSDILAGLREHTPALIRWFISSAMAHQLNCSTRCTVTWVRCKKGCDRGTRWRPSSSPSGSKR
jgi:hypothetical protein